MNKVKRFFQSSIVKTTGKMLALIGVALTFAACYAPAPMPDEYFESAPDDSMLYNDLDMDDDTPVDGEATSNGAEQDK